MKRLTVVMLAVASTPVVAQWLNYRESGMPRTKALAPRVAGGKPDLSGVWIVEATPRQEFQKLLGNDFDKLDVPGKLVAM
jgi:hypothetical protein